MVVVGHAPGVEPLGPVAALGNDVRTIDLRPLGDADAAQLVIDTAPSLRDDLVARIVAAAAGNPFVLTELARTPIDGELPDSLQRLGAWLLDSLPARTRSLVRDVLILGARVPLALAAQVLDSLSSGIVVLWSSAAPVLRLVDDFTVVFGHEAYRRVAYEALPFQRRRALHAEWPTAAAQPDAADALRAVHLEAAGRTAEAYPLAAAVGRTASSAGAPRRKRWNCWAGPRRWPVCTSHGRWPGCCSIRPRPADGWPTTPRWRGSCAVRAGDPTTRWSRPASATCGPTLRCATTTSPLARRWGSGGWRWWGTVMMLPI